MTSTRPARGALISAAVALVAVLSGCSSDDGGGTAAASSATATSAPSTAPSTDPVGAGCAQLPADALAALATQPVGSALPGVPLLSTLATAVGAANLTSALDAQSGITVFAPVDAAFGAVPADQTNALLADLPRLTSVLQHHVVSGRLSPDQVVGDHTTLLGDTVTVTGSADAPVVSADQTLLGAADATVVCGNVQTANATLYLVDQVLAPQA